MKSLITIIETFKSECLDGRDFNRLVDFLTFEQAEDLLKRAGSGWKDPAKAEEIKAKWQTPKAWTPENIKAQLGEDVAFGFDKALDKRGISAGLMYEVVKMWMWILDDPLADHDKYAQYGLPLFKAVAVKYGFPNPIGDDNGSEDKYDSGSDG